MKTEQLKKLSIQVMVGSLIAAAVLAVVAVLAGSFNDTFVRALLTLGLVAFHALASLAFIGSTEKKSSQLAVFNNTVFVVIVLSFFTSVLGTWEALSGALVGKLYLTYLIVLFASLHGEMLAQTLGKEAYINRVVYANYALMAFVILLLLPIVWSPDTDFAGFYYRLLAASGIVDATLTILAVIFHRLYLQKHPRIKSTIFAVVPGGTDANGNPLPAQAQVVEQKRRIHPLVWILGIFLIGQVALSALFALLGAFYR
jgi:hypothetical protein